jgi:hypothetical protein
VAEKGTKHWALIDNLIFRKMAYHQDHNLVDFPSCLIQTQTFLPDIILFFDSNDSQKITYHKKL